MYESWQNYKNWWCESVVMVGLIGMIKAWRWHQYIKKKMKIIKDKENPFVIPLFPDHKAINYGVISSIFS